MDEQNPMLPTDVPTQAPASVPPLVPMAPPMPNIPTPAVTMKKPASSKRWLWISLIAVVVLAGAAYGWMMLNPATLVAEVTVTPMVSPTATAGPTADWKTYMNTQYGFEVKLPPTWQGYLVTVAPSPYWDTVCFSVPHAQDQGFCLFQLVFFTPEQWKTFADSSSTARVPIARNASYVVVAEYSSGGGQFSQFQADRSVEIPAIIPTFKFTK